jgi:hypothetical protein
MIGAMFIGALIVRISVGDCQLTDALVPLVMLALFRSSSGSSGVHPALAPKAIRPADRRSAARPRALCTDGPAQRSPDLHTAKSLLRVLSLAVAVALLAFPRVGMGLTCLVFISALGLGYEWTHYLVHSDYKPETRVYRAIWRNHRQHHFKNGRYWFTVTSSCTADRILGTYPDLATVETSRTAKNPRADVA